VSTDSTLRDARRNRDAGVDSTLRDVRRRPGAGKWGQRIGLAILFVIVVAGAAGLFGVRSRTTTVHANGYSLTVTYPQVARSGLDVPWRARVTYPNPPPKSITIAVSSQYFEMFETQGFYPSPDTQKNDGHFVQFTYQSPPASGMTLEYDAYIQPAAQIGKRATVQVLVNGSVVAQAKIHTWLVP
jgi:hypothetical protein